MAATPEVAPLAARKQILIEKSDLLRARLDHDCAQLRRPAQMLDRGYGVVRRFRPGLAIVVPIVGFLLSRRQVRGSLKKALALLSFVKTAQKALRGRSRGRRLR